MFNLSDSALVPIEGATDSVSPGGTYFVGLADWHMCYHVHGAVDLFGIQFRHEYLRELLRCDLHELKGRQVILSEFWGVDAERLQKKLSSEPCNTGRIAIVEQVLAKRCRELREPNSVLLATFDALAWDTGRQHIASICHAVGVSERQLERIYKQHLGLSPKRFSSVTRFWRSSLMLKMGVDIADIAHTLGFADQPHFNRTFRRYAGIPPSTFVREPDVGFVQDSDRDDI